MKTLVFDFGGVLVDWNPHYFFDEYFADPDKASWFISNICTSEWNEEMDAGKTFAEGCAELAAKYPEWETEIYLYNEAWWRMLGKTDMKMYAFVKRLKEAGVPLYGLTNWPAEKWLVAYPVVPTFHLLEGIVVSGQEKMHKPQHEFFQVLFDRYGLDPKECVFVDDRESNIIAARELGMGTVHFNKGVEQGQKEILEALGL